MRLLSSTFALVALCSTLAIGQQRGQAPPANPALPAPPAPGQRGGGGGRGRGAVQVMTLTSSAWPDGGQIPVKYTQADIEVSPALSWSNVPEGAASFVLIAHDVDAAIGNGTDDILHWMLWNIPPTVTSLPEGVPAPRSCPTARARSARPGRAIAARVPRPRDPPITTCSSCSRWTRCWTCLRSARRRRIRAPRSSPRWRDTSAEKPPTSVSSSGADSTLNAEP